MKCVNAKVLPKDQNLSKKQHRVEVAKELLNNVAENHSRVYAYDVETVQHSSEWHFKNETKPKKLKFAEGT